MQAAAACSFGYRIWDFGCYPCGEFVGFFLGRFLAMVSPRVPVVSTSSEWFFLSRVSAVALV